MCCLVLRSNLALLLTIQFVSLISSLINIISLLLTTFDWTKVRGIAPRSHTGRPRTCLVLVTLLVKILMNHVFLPLLPCPRWGMERGGGTPLRSVVGNGRLPPLPSLRRGGGGGEPPRPQPDTLDKKLHSSPTKFRPNLPSTHHVDDWGENGAYRPPSPTSLQPRTKRKREERERPIDQARAADFYEKSAKRLSPYRERPRSPRGARPRSSPMRAAPAENSRIHWGLTRPYDVHTQLGKRVARPRNEATRHNSVASSNWQRTQARNRSRVREQDAPPAPYPRPRQRRDSADRPRHWSPLPRTPKIQPVPSEPHHRARQPPGCADLLDYRAERGTMERPDRDRPHETQRPRVPSAAPLSGQSREYPPRDDYGRRSTPPARSRSPPAHAISDSDESDTETRPRWTDLSPRKAPRRDDDAFVDDQLSDADVDPDPTHDPYRSKQASSHTPEPEPSTSRDQSYAWPPAPRDFDPDHAESVASNEDEPDFSFAAVVDMIRNYHDIDRPTTRTTTVFDQTRGVQSDRGPAFNLPTSPLLGGLIDNANSAMARLTREQSNGFLPFPMKRHWWFYRTDSTSLSAPYVVPPSLASLTREKPGDNKRLQVSLSQSVLAGLESALASIGETASWLDWWLSTVSGFSEALQPSAQSNFKRLLASGSKAIAFVGSQTVPALTNLLLSHSDALLAEVRYTVPAEELSLLRHSPLPPAAEILPSSRLDTALSKARAASNDALVHKALHPPRIPKRPAQGSGRSNPAYPSEDTSGRSPLAPRHQQPPRPNSQANAEATNNNGRNRANRRPFPRPTGRSGNSGGKGIGSGKRSN